MSEYVRFKCKECGEKTSAKNRTGREVDRLCGKCYLKRSHAKLKVK